MGRFGAENRQARRKVETSAAARVVFTHAEHAHRFPRAQGTKNGSPVYMFDCGCQEVSAETKGAIARARFVSPFTS